MTWHKLSPTILTLLIFLLAQGLGTILLFGVFMLTSPEFSSAVHAYMSGEAQSLPLLEMMPASTFSFILMVVDVLAVMGCYFLLHNIRLLKADDFSSIKWRPGILAIVGGILGAISISILTEKVPLPDTMLQMSQEMSHNIIGLLTLVVVGPITEELLFREAIEGEMLRRGTNPWLAIIISAIAFGVAHLNFVCRLVRKPGLSIHRNASIRLAQHPVYDEILGKTSYQRTNLQQNRHYERINASFCVNFFKV